MSESRDLGDVKYINQWNRDIVFGFMKQMQSLFPKESINYTIPTLVIHWILLYFTIGDQFDENNCASSYALSQRNTLLTKSEVDMSSAYLSNIVTKGKHQWKFELKKLDKNDGFYMTSIGIWKAKFSPNLTKRIDHCVLRRKVYGWIVNLQQTLEFKRYGDICVTGDIIDMILDLDKRTLTTITYPWYF